MKQTIYISLDDSGKLSNKEKISVYGGIIFFKKEDLDKFLYDYEKLVNKLKEKYFDKKTLKYLELKHFNLKKQDVKILINYLKKYHLLTGVIDNKKVYKNIIDNSKSKGRFLDYVVKMTIKNAIVNLIKENIIDPNKELEIIINIDEQNYKSNGYYNLKDSIYEELKYGMTNIKNNTNFKAIIKGNLTINLSFVNSSKSFLIQAADIIAGYTRKCNIQYYQNTNELKRKMKFINYQIYFPK